MPESKKKPLIFSRGGSRLLHQSTSTGGFATTGAIGAIFLHYSLSQVDPRQIGEGGKPGKNISEFPLQLFAREFSVPLLAQCGGQFTNFLCEPKEGALNATLGILGAV
jgi:hypothetical protein